jgi:hypothetical protein
MKTTFLTDHLGSMDRKWYVSSGDKLTVHLFSAVHQGHVDPPENTFRIWSKATVKTSST